MNNETAQLINRYLDAYQIVTRRIGVRIREGIAEGVTSDQFTILRLIHGQEKCTSTYLAEAFCVGKSSITAIVNRLADAGLIDRTRDENDRRQVYLTISSLGSQVFAEANRRVSEILTPYLLHFEDDQIELFISMFEKLAALMMEPGGQEE